MGRGGAKGIENYKKLQNVEELLKFEKIAKWKYGKKLKLKNFEN